MDQNISAKDFKQKVDIWNDEHIEMFKIRYTDDETIEGVIRLFSFDENSQVRSRCLKVTNHDNTYMILRNFIEKAGLDIYVPDLSLYVVFSNAEFQYLSYSDCPLLTQLSFIQYSHEGRFYVKFNRILKKVNGKENSSVSSITDKLPYGEHFLHSEEQLQKDIQNLFAKVPTSKISTGVNNQERMLKRQRQQKLNSKINELLEFENNHGKKDILNSLNIQNKVGTLKIFTGSIFPESQYKTIFINIYDNVRNVIKEVLKKLPIPKKELRENEYFLTMLISSKRDSKKLVKKNKSEYRILDDDYPLYLQNKLSNNDSSVTFHLKRFIHSQDLNMQVSQNQKVLKTDKKYFAILHKLESSELNQPSDHPGSIGFNRDLIVFGSNSNLMKKIDVHGHQPNQLYVLKEKSIHPVHCIISSLNGVLSITPSNIEADVRVNGAPIFETIILNDGVQISLGCSYFFQTLIPTRASANTSQIYWKAYQPSPTKNNSPKAEVFKIMDKKNLEVLLPMYLKFDQSFFENLLEKLLELLLTDKVFFKPTSAYLLYLVFITQYDNHVSYVESPKNPNDIIKDFRSFCKICYRTLIKLNMLRDCEIEVNLLWLTNLSEFMNFICQDVYLKPFTDDIQMFCQHSLRISMNEIIRIFETEFLNLIDAIFCPVIETEEILNKINTLINFDPSINSEILEKNFSKDKNLIHRHKSNENIQKDVSDILVFLNRWMTLVGKYHINPSYIVQIFQRFFNSITKNIIDKIIVHNFSSTKSYDVIDTAKININILQMWAESQGLEVIFEKSFSFFYQLLEFFDSEFSSPNSFTEAIQKISFFNSKQLEMILSNLHKYVGTLKSLNQNFRAFQDQAKSISVRQLRDMEIKENIDVQNLKIDFQMPIIKPLLITNDGYTSENPQDVTNILFKIIKTIDIPDIKILRAQDNHSNWNCRFKDNIEKQSNSQNIMIEYMIITLDKGDLPNFGINIFQIESPQTGIIGLYVSNIQDSSVAKNDGRLSVGDQIISANGISMIGMTEKIAEKHFQSFKNTVKLEVIKKGAHYNKVFHILRPDDVVVDTNENDSTEFHSPQKNNIKPSTYISSTPSTPDIKVLNEMKSITDKIELIKCKTSSDKEKTVEITKTQSMSPSVNVSSIKKRFTNLENSRTRDLGIKSSKIKSKDSTFEKIQEIENNIPIQNRRSLNIQHDYT